jgi:hypothetical protein
MVSRQRTSDVQSRLTIATRVIEQGSTPSARAANVEPSDGLEVGRWVPGVGGTWSARPSHEAAPCSLVGLRTARGRDRVPASGPSRGPRGGSAESWASRPRTIYAVLRRSGLHRLSRLEAKPPPVPHRRRWPSSARGSQRDGVGPIPFLGRPDRITRHRTRPSWDRDGRPIARTATRRS